MNKLNLIKSFHDLLSEVKELKKLQQRVLLNLENHKINKAVNPLELEERISAKETCRLLGCSEVTLWKLRKDGTLPYSKHKRTIRFKKIDVLNYLNQKG